MNIYTRAGDDGTTAGPDGLRVAKNHPRMNAVGTIDELSAHVGLCVQCAAGEQYVDILSALSPIQGELLVVGGILAAAGTDSKPAVSLDELTGAKIEQLIDAAMGVAGPLEHFVIPGGCELACRLHVARTVCRRAERRIIDFADTGAAIPTTITAFINRLGDLLFALARMANKLAGVAETTWPDQPQ